MFCREPKTDCAIVIQFFVVFIRSLSGVLNHTRLERG